MCGQLLRVLAACTTLLFASGAAASECVTRCENSCYNHDRACPSGYVRGSSPTNVCLRQCRFEAANRCEVMCYTAMLDRRGKRDCLAACNDGVVRTYFRTVDGHLYVQR